MDLKILHKLSCKFFQKEKNFNIFLFDQEKLFFRKTKDIKTKDDSFALFDLKNFFLKVQKRSVVGKK